MPNSKTGPEEEHNEALEPDPPADLRRDASIDSGTTELNKDCIKLSNSTVKSTADDETCAATQMDKSVYSNGLEPQSPDPFLPPLSVATCVASPTIDQSTQSSRPLSESKIKAAIKNVAKAGYLHISTTAIHLPDQALQSEPQQSDKVKTSSSSKKRKREEQGVPNEDKKVKKQAVPMREQSSRYDTLHIIFYYY